jgi:imidazolonepropionase
MKLIYNASEILTVNSNGKGFKIKDEMQELGIIPNGAMIFDDKVEFVGSEKECRNYIKENNIIINEEINAHKKSLLPGFIDAHTHIVFGGDRTKEFAMRLRGATYKEIAAMGGGIQTTVDATRRASIEELYQTGHKLASNAIKHGTTCMEVKSGYSLNFDGEIKQLQAIKMLNSNIEIDIVPTFLGAHDFPAELKHDRDRYIDVITQEMLPYIKENNLAQFCDCFIDEGYYTVEEGRRVLNAGISLGFDLKVHCDELADVGAAKLAAELGSISADHLLFISDESIDALVKSGTAAGLLPGTAYFIRLPYAPARKLIEKGVIVSIASDCNPGSCFTENMQQILSLSAINMNMTAEECISAATINAAYALKKQDSKGSLEKGKDADFILLNSSSYINLFYHFGVNNVSNVYARGKKLV